MGVTNKGSRDQDVAAVVLHLYKLWYLLLENAFDLRIAVPARFWT